MKFYITSLRQANFQIVNKIGFAKRDHFCQWAFNKPFEELKTFKDMVNGWNRKEMHFKIMPGTENKYDLDRMLMIYISKYGDFFDRGIQENLKGKNDE